MKIAVQLDFDGTVTEEDVSYLLLDNYTGDKWRRYLDEYSAGKISVATFSKKAFGMVKADEKTMTDFVLGSERVKIRPGFAEYLRYCGAKGIKNVIVSNGLSFYIDAILKKHGLGQIEVFAAACSSDHDGLKVVYIGPDGRELDSGFKEAYTRFLKQQGYGVIYVGNGASDIHPARLARYVFATDDLLRHCRAEGISCIPFSDFHDVVRGMQKLLGD
ncbi:MAG: HAD-IB family phosphatase [Dehalococcoidales bacterium]|nr:HAD-IB family phosphatase [Dehalococcoidales bacterium]